MLQTAPPVHTLHSTHHLKPIIQIPGLLQLPSHDDFLKGNLLLQIPSDSLTVTAAGGWLGETSLRSS